MCKKLKKYLLFFLTLMIMTGCSSQMNFSDKDMDIYEKIHKKYMNMESYSAKAAMTVYSNKTENKYSILQYVKEPGMYRTEFLEKDGKADTVIYEKDGNIIISQETGSPLVAQSEGVPDCTYVNNFFKLYYKSQATAINVSAAEDSKTVLLETDIFPVSQNAKKAVMTVDNEANVKSLCIYDMGGKLYIRLEFTEFNYNTDLSDEIFILR